MKPVHDPACQENCRDQYHAGEQGYGRAPVCSTVEKYDLVLCGGDDLTDESMFALDQENLLSIKVGDGQTQARSTGSPSPAEFRSADLLEKFQPAK